MGYTAAKEMVGTKVIAKFKLASALKNNVLVVVSIT